MLEIKTGVVVGLTVDGKEYPLEHGGFQQLTIAANKRMSLTTIELVLTDISGQFENNITLSDGTPFIVKVGQTVNKLKEYKFRVFKFQKIPSGGMSQYKIVGYWDSPSWFFNTVKQSVQGTSSEVIKKLATNCNLEVDVHSTNDSMLWLSQNARNCAFARNVCERGYVDDDSFMVLGMTHLGQIRYWNINQNTNTDNLPSFVHGDTGAPNTYRVADHTNLAQSGFGNAMGGYMHSVREQSILGDVQAITELNVKLLSQQTMLNKEVKQGMETGRIEIAPIDCGNVHDKWNKARYQNQRNSNVYSLGVELLIMQPTENLGLFDRFVYQAADPPGVSKVETNQGYKGVYIVTANAIHIEVGNYYEKIQGYSTGLNLSGDGGQEDGGEE